MCTGKGTIISEIKRGSSYRSHPIFGLKLIHKDTYANACNYGTVRLGLYHEVIIYGATQLLCVIREVK
jgi:hypothetical protein